MSQASPEPAVDPQASPPELLSDRFVARSFGGEMLWAKGKAFEAKILRVRAGQNVRVTGKGRVDMHVMLTGGRACLKSVEANNAEEQELLPAQAVGIDPEKDYRLVALTDAELLSVYSPATSPA